MTHLTIALPDALRDYLETQIAAGHYNSVDDYIQTLIQQDRARKEHLEPLLQEGFASGNATLMTVADWETIRATVHQNTVRQNTVHQNQDTAISDG